jgi:hypothetical protein
LFLVAFKIRLGLLNKKDKVSIQYSSYYFTANAKGTVNSGAVKANVWPGAVLARAGKIFVWTVSKARLK